MSTVIKTPNAPYYDDFDAAKKFLRILFRPGFAVQTRELNQLQTILNDQISVFADFFFQNGQKVIGGEVSSVAQQAYVKLATPLNREDDSLYIGAQVKNSVETLSGQIVKIVRAENGDPDTIYVEYNNTSTVDNVTQAFALNDPLIITLTDSSVEAAQVGSASDSVGFGSLVTVRAGIYYMIGQFVRVDEQTVIVSKYSVVDSTAENTLGFELFQTNLASEEDTSLLDNALGSPNETAPGAHRLIIEAVLKKIEDVLDITNFVRIVTLQGEQIVTQTRDTDFTVFEDILAKRTFDESGDYIIDDFLIEVREHLNDGTNRGLFLDGDESKFGVILDQGKAYVRGYEVATTSNTTLVADKARTTEARSSLLVDASYESAFVISNLVNAPNTFSRIELKEGVTTIGTAFVKALSFREQEALVDFYRLDFFNAVFTVAGKSLSNVDNISQTTSSFTADVETLLFNATQTKNFFEIPFGFVSNLSALNMLYYREYNNTVNGTDLPITSAVNDQFIAGVDNYVVIIGGVVDRPVGVVRTAGNTQATLDVSNFGAVNGQPARVIAKTSRTGAIPRSKSLTQVVESIAAASTITLTKVDVQSIDSIIVGGIDVTSYYELDGGQRDTHYTYGRLTIKAGFAVPSGTADITYNYFEHGSGDFFGPQSYENINYEDIPFYTSSSGRRVFLGSVIDFRPRISSATQYEVSGAQGISSVDDVTASFSYYLGRIDKVCVDRTGKFEVIPGIPALNPIAPLDLDGAITLYELIVPPYTFAASDIRANKFNYKRFTMKDIASLENRIDTLEYVSALNLLEVDATQRENVDKFKSGFLVDNFRSQNVGDFENAAHQISLDMSKGEARPIAVASSVPFRVDTSQSSGYVNNNGVITLPFTEVTEIKQTLASSLERLQPYTLFNWIGSAGLIPANDTWVTTEVKPDIVINNGTIGAVQALVSPILALGSFWNWWGNQAANRNFRGSQVATVNTTASTQTTFTPVPFIRSRSVNFDAFGMKPNTKVTPIFDGVDVSAFCRPIGGNLGDPIIVSGAGTVAGTFVIPNNSSVRFRTGRRKFILSDAGTDANAANTYAEAVYTADGTLQAVQRTVLQTRVIENRPGARRRDPLAQSFAVERDGGAFVTSIEVYFGPEASVNDQDVTCEIRGMTNGFPNEEVIARKVLTSASIVGSTDATVATKFTFDYPIYLEEDVEYCFVLLSNSLTLTAWIAALGEKERRSGDTIQNSGQVITKQPFIGSLFKSQNNITWTPAQTEDLKFKINRANFNAATIGNVVFENFVGAEDADTEVNVFSSDLSFDPFEFTSGSPSVRVFFDNHGFRVGDTVTLSGPSVGSLNGIPVGQIYGARTVVSVATDSFTFTAASNATSSGRNGGDGQVSSAQVEYSDIFLNSANVVLNGTAIEYSLKAFNRSSNAMDVSYIPVTNKDTEYLTSSRVAKASGDKTTLVRATLRSTASNISPVLDAGKIGLVAIKNRINNESESLTSDSGSVARYIQKSVSLVNPANEITVYADVSRPAGSSISMFYKVGQADASEQENWIALPAVGIQATTESQDEFKEYKWSIQIPSEFSSVKIKWVLNSNDPAKVPRVKNYRALFLNV